MATTRASRVYSTHEEEELEQIASTPRDTWRSQIDDFCKRNKRTDNKDYSRVYAKVAGILARSQRGGEAESNNGVSHGRGRRGGRRQHTSPLAAVKELSVSPNEIRFTVKALRIESKGSNLEFVVEI